MGAFIIGKLVETKNEFSFLWLVGCMMIGTILIYATGVIHLIVWIKINAMNAFIIGILPFLPEDTLKMLAAAYITYRIKKIFPTFLP